MVQLSWRQPPLTPAEANDLFMVMLEDDTEEAPWMVMGDLQFWSASSLAHSLRAYARRQHLPWYVASMMPIDYRWPPVRRKKRLAPDLFVAFVPDHPRASFDVETEGAFPPFVVEVVSPSSTERDEKEKLIAYDLLKVREYLLFTPTAPDAGTLTGYHRDADNQFVPWPADDQGRLWSAVLDLAFAARGRFIQAQTAGGDWLLIPDQTEDALQQAEGARRAAEAEAARLRRELDDLRRSRGPAG
jgi:Uma2 family endonuclease